MMIYAINRKLNESLPSLQTAYVSHSEKPVGISEQIKQRENRITYSWKCTHCNILPLKKPLTLKKGDIIATKQNNSSMK